jgi:predicted metal-dependent phosphoesterase TrpH
MKFDLHMHTLRYSPDSQMDPFTLVRQARRVGLDGVVITEHDWLWTEAELEELRAAAPGLIVLAGIEVTAQEGHFLVYGVKNPYALPKGIRVADLCREMHHQGGAVVAAHPFRWGQPFDEILRDQQPDLDGMELLSNNMDPTCREKAARVFRELSLAGLGCSDAHHEEVLGVCYTEFGADIRNVHDLVDAIRKRRSVPCERKTANGV